MSPSTDVAIEFAVYIALATPEARASFLSSISALIAARTGWWIGDVIRKRLKMD